MLMSDLRGFTSMSERLPPERVVAMLNRYLTSMVDVIKQYQGTIDEFIGDAIFVLFGAPTWQEDDARAGGGLRRGDATRHGGGQRSRTRARTCRSSRWASASTPARSCWGISARRSA